MGPARLVSGSFGSGLIPDLSVTIFVPSAASAKAMARPLRKPSVASSSLLDSLLSCTYLYLGYLITTLDSVPEAGHKFIGFL